MNHPPSGESRAELENLRCTVNKLYEAVSTESQRLEKKRKVYLTLGAVVTVACCISLSVLTSMAFQLDAEALSQIGRHEIEKNLPQSRQNMKAYLEARAPEFTSHFIDSLIGLLPQLRPVVLRELDKNMRQITADFEEELITLMEASINTTKADLDRRFPNLSDAEKIEMLVSAVAAKFNENMENLLSELYPRYAAEMQYVESYLKKLRDKDESELSAREKSEKELIETLLRLIVREQRK